MATTKTISIGGHVGDEATGEALLKATRSDGVILFPSRQEIFTVLDMVDEIERDDSLPLQLVRENSNGDLPNLRAVCVERGLPFFHQTEPDDADGDFPGARIVFVPALGMTEPKSFDGIGTLVDAWEVLALHQAGDRLALDALLAVATFTEDDLEPLSFSPEVVGKLRADAAALEEDDTEIPGP